MTVDNSGLKPFIDFFYTHILKNVVGQYTFINWFFNSTPGPCGAPDNICQLLI